VNHKQIEGLAVISIADGAKVGTINQMFVDTNARRLVGFGIRPEGGRLSEDTPNVIDIDDIYALGADALTLNDTNAVRGDRTRAAMSGLVDVDELTKRKVMTEGGTHVGEVASLEFDDRSYALSEVEVSPGFFKSNQRVPIAQVINVGDMVIVANEVCASPDATDEEDEDDGERRFVVGDVVQD